MKVSDYDTLKVMSEIDTNSIVWESSNPEVVSVDNGLLLALKSGTSEVTASYKGVTSSCEVTVDLTIFLGGSAKEFEAAYWKNGVINYLTTTGNDEGYYSQVNTIKVLNGQVLAGGLKMESNSVIWRGEEEIILGEGFEEVQEMAIKGNDVFAIIDNGGLYKWNENDGPTFLRDEGHITNALFVEGGDVYVGGVVKTGEEYRPAIWKNGDQLILDYEQYAYITDVYVENGDFYSVGLEGIGSGVYQIKYWVNTTKYNLADSPDAWASCVIVEAGDLYISGHNNDRPAVWINGEISYYAEQGVTGVVNEMLLFDGDFYAAGVLRIGFNSVGVVWKNGEELFRTDIFEDANIKSIEIK